MEDQAVRDLLQALLQSQPPSKRKQSPTRSSWTPLEDSLLREAIMELKMTDWLAIAKHIGKNSGRPIRDNQQVAQHWKRVINPTLITGPFTAEEKERLHSLYLYYGKRWCLIGSLMNRKDTTIKRYVERCII